MVSTSKPLHPNALRVSQAGLDLIKRFEGFSATVYPCPAGKPTIGYGHALKPGEAFPHPISQADATDLLAEDCRLAEIFINANVRARLAQHEFDALVCFVYNIGIGAFDRSTLRFFLNKGDRAAAANEFLRWNKAKGIPVEGLTRRRMAEAKMFLGETA